MAANTPVQPGLGGARPNSGRKKGSTALIRIQSLREAFDAELGMPFEIMLAKMQLKLHNDFQNDINVDAAIRFTSNMAKHMIQPVPQVMEIDSKVENLTSEEINDKLANLLTLAALSAPKDDQKKE